MTIEGFLSILWLIYYDIVLIPHLFPHVDSSMCFCRLLTWHGCYIFGISARTFTLISI